MVLQGLISAGLLLAPAVSSLAATATWCQKDTRLREIVLVREVDGPCEVDYNKPFEDGLHPRLWRARQDLQFCEDRRKELIAKLGREGWLCSLDFFVHNGRFDRNDIMAQAARSLKAYRSVVAANLEKLSKLEGNVSFATSVGLYQGRYGEAGSPVSEDDGTSYFDVEQASDQAIFLFWTLVHCENAADDTPVYCHYLGFDDGSGSGASGVASVSSCPTVDSVAEAADIFLIGNSRAQNHVVSASKEGIVFSNPVGGAVDAVIRAERSAEAYRMVCAPSTP
jgi:hypothetical protein